MPIVKFEQDPEAPLGTGNFTDDTGKTVYEHDPETASRFIPLMPGKSLKPPPPTEPAPTGAAPPPATGASPAQPTAEPFQAPPQPPANAIFTPPGSEAPAPAPAGAPTSPQAEAPASGATDRANALLSSLNAVTSKLGAPKGTALASRTVQQGADPARVAARVGTVLDSAERTAAATEELGAKRTERAQQQADIGIKAAEDEISQAQGEIVGRGRAAQEAEQQRLAVELEKDPEINSGRLLEQMGTGKTIGMVILAALNGAFGAQIGQRENGVIRALENAIDKDIAAQREQINSGRIRRGNLIQHFKERGYDERKAEEAARAALKMAIGRKTELEAARLGASEHTEAAKLEAQKIYAQGQAQALALDAAADPVVQDTFAPPRPTGGGMSPSDYLAMMKIRDAEIEKANAGDVARAIDSRLPEDDPRKGNVMLSAEEAEKIKTDAQEYAQRVAVNKTTEQTVEAVAKEIGLERDKDGKWVDTGKMDPGLRPYGVTAFSPKARKVDKLWSQLKEAKIMNMSREPANTLQAEFGEAIERPFWDSDIPDLLNMVEDRARAANENLKSGFKEAALYYESGGELPDPGYQPGKSTVR